MNTPVKILVLDDHELIAYGLKYKLEQLFSDVEVDIFTSGDVTLQQIKKKKYDLYIIDIELKDISGIDVIRDLKALNPSANIFVYTLHEEMWYVKVLKELQVSGILFKTSRMDLLDKALIELLNGRTFYCDRYKEMINNHKEVGFRYLLYESFTENEKIVLGMIGKGLTIKEIAEEKCWSVKTVEYYRKRLFDKFGVTNVSRLVAIAMREGFLKKDDI